MKTALRLLLILWGITFSSSSEADLSKQNYRNQDVALFKKTTQTCGAAEAANAFAHS
jgi:hypothetical protein